MNDEALRGLLDERGLLRADAPFDPPGDAWTVFAQRSDARLDVAALRRNAEGFFSATLGLTTPKRHAGEGVERDVATVILARSGGQSAARTVWSRPADAGDHARAEDAERESGGGGLGLLAARCRQIWIVERHGPDDEVSLTIAAIFASVMLGPITGDREIFGVRGARERLAKLG